MSSSLPRHRADFASQLREVYKRFQRYYSNTDEAILLKQDELSFLGIPIEIQLHYDPQNLRRSIKSMLGLKEEQKSIFIEVVGDSSGEGFTNAGIKAIHKAISEAIGTAQAAGRDEHLNVIIEYGYTAGAQDANWAVNDFVTSSEGGQQDISVAVVGNVVHASATAIETGNYEALTNVTHFVLAYGRDHKTNFGEDIWYSDSILISGDVIICAEGGPQSFYQVATVCARDVRTVVITGEEMRKEGQTRFSAAALIQKLQHHIERWNDRNDRKRHDRPINDLKTRLREKTDIYVQGFEFSQTPISRYNIGMINAGLNIFLRNISSLSKLTILDIDDAQYDE